MNKIELIAQTKLPTRWGTFTLIGFEETETRKEHVAVTMGNITETSPVLTRIHSECLTGDALFSMRCDCGPQLEGALKTIADVGTGVVLYMRQEGRGIGLINKIKAYGLQDQGLDTVEANHKLGFDADHRDYAFCAQMLKLMGVDTIDLMTNNPKKITALEAQGITVHKRIAHKRGENPHNDFYLKTKCSKLGHLPE